MSYCWGLDPGQPLRAVRPWAGSLTSLGLSFFTFKIELIILLTLVSM